MKKIAAITMFVLTTATPVYSYAADPCEVVYVCTEKLQETAEVANANQQKKHSSTFLRKRKVQYDGVKHLMHVKHF